MSIYRDLGEALSQALLGTSYDKSATVQERFLIDDLVEKAEDYGIGDIDLPELQQAFAGTGFDVTQWVNEMVAAGHFTADEPDAS